MTNIIRYKFVKQHHESPQSGNFVIRKTLTNKLKENFKWKYMSQIIKQFVNNCDLYQRIHTKEPFK